MADESQTGKTDSPPPLDASTVARIVRDELDRGNKYLEFAQGQAAGDRAYFKHLYSYAVGFLAFMVAVAGYFSYTSVSQMRAEMKASVEAELARDKGVVESAADSAKSQVDRELGNVRTEVQKRLDTEFQSDNIKALVAQAATKRTEKELTGIIRTEVSSQVARGIQEQAPAIKSAVETQTNEAVKELQPTISAAVDQATQSQVKTSVAPIQSQMTAYGDVIRMGTMATLARSDDRDSFDYLVDVALGKKPESANAELRKLADTTVGAIILETDSTIHSARVFKEKQTPEAIRKFMTSANILEREAALDSYPGDDKTILPVLVDLIRSDKSISVEYKAVSRFNALTKQSFEFWNTSTILDWWSKNQNSFQ